MQTGGEARQGISPPGGGYGRKAAGSAIWVGISQTFKMLGLLMSVPIVARILSPSDFGVAAMAAPITTFLLFFQDLGLSQSVIQADEINQSQKNGLFWINVTISVAVSVTLLLISPLAGDFYKDGRAANFVAASSISVIITGMSLLHIALLSRAMRFKVLAIIDICQTATLIVTSIVFAWLMHSYWSIWLSTLCGICVQSVLLWTFDEWRPNIRPSYKDTGQMVKFGRGLAGFNLTNFAVRNLDNILIGKFSGSAALGFYDQSYKLMMAPMQAINGPLARVTLPVLGRLRNQPERYRRAYLLVLRCLQTGLTPGLAVVIATSDHLVPALLGEKWAGASPIFQWLCLTGILQPLGNSTGWLFISSGRTAEMFRWGVFSAIVTAAGFVVGLHWGATGVAASLFLTSLARTPLLLVYSSTGTSVRAADFYRISAEPAVAGIATYFLASLIMGRLPFWPGFILSVAIGYVLIAATLWLTRDGRIFLTTAIGTLTNLAKRA